MQTHGLRRGGKWIALMLLAVAMTALGATYAGWTDALHIRGRLTTASFDMAASPEGEYRVGLVRPDGRLEKSVTVEARTGADGKSVELSFPGGLPAAELGEGYFLCLSVPIENGGGSFMNIRRYEPDFSRERGRVTLYPQEALAQLEGTAYLAENRGDALSGALAAFLRPLELTVHPAFEGAPEAMRGTLYLALTEDSRAQLAALPRELELPAEVLEFASQETPVGLFGLEETTADGVAVRYRCEVPLAMDQSDDPEQIAWAGEEAVA